MSKNPFDIKRYRKYSMEKHATKNKNPSSYKSGKGKKTSTAKKGKRKATKILTAEDIKKVLEDYVEIPKDEWSTLTRGSQIKFFKNKKGNPPFTIDNYKDRYDRYGGFIQFIKPSLYEDGTEITSLGLSWGYKYNTGIRVIPVNVLKSIWKKEKNILGNNSVEYEAKTAEPVSENTISRFPENRRTVHDIKTELSKIKRDLDDKTEDLKSGHIKLRGDMEDLVELVAEMIQKKRI